MSEFEALRSDVMCLLRKSGFLLITVILTACQAEQESVLPPRSVASTSSPSPGTKFSSQPHDEVVRAYVTYWMVLAKAGKSSPELARKLLRPYVEGAYLNHLVDGVRQMEKQGREPYGQMIPGVKEVRVGGKQAEVIDCQDMSRAAMADRGTHQIIAKTANGKTTANIKATLRMSSDGRWRLTGLSFREGTCTPPSR